GKRVGDKPCPYGFIVALAPSLDPKEKIARNVKEHIMILVTGATGKSGRAIVKQLAEAGAQVRALVRDPAKAAWLAELPGVEIVQGDLSKPETLDAAFVGIERALLLP